MIPIVWGHLCGNYRALTPPPPPPPSSLLSLLQWQRLAEFLRDTYGAISSEVLGRSDKASKEAMEQVSWCDQGRGVEHPWFRGWGGVTQLKAPTPPQTTPPPMMQVQAELVALKRDLAAATARAEAAESLASASAAECVLLAEAGSQMEREMGGLRASGEAAAARVEELEVALMEMEEVWGD